LLKEAKQYMERHADPEYWRKRSPAQKDALYLTYYNMGPKQIEQRRPENMQAHKGKYQPRPGKDTAAGINHEGNADVIARRFGHPSYTKKPETEAPTTPQITPVPQTTSPPDTTPRPHSAQLTRRHNEREVELQPGGTLSDIVVLERARGNSISVGDLRAVNGLKPEHDRRLPAGLILLVPQRHANRLQVKDPGTELQFDPQNGSFTLQQDMGNGRARHFSRSWDDRRQCYYSTYSEHDSAGAIHHLLRFEIEADYRARLRAAYRRLPGEWVEVVSSNLARVGHDEDSLILTIQFVKGREYEYYLVPRQVYLDLLGAPSKGQYFNQTIKAHYAYSRL
jgi:hypothetical protein